jgi:MFS family permease
MTVAPVAGALADRIGERPLMVTGLSLHAAGMASLAAIAEPEIAYLAPLAAFILAGVGVSLAIPAAQNSVVGSLTIDAVGKAAGANSMMRELGCSSASPLPWRSSPARGGAGLVSLGLEARRARSLWSAITPRLRRTWPRHRSPER